MATTSLINTFSPTATHGSGGVWTAPFTPSASSAAEVLVLFLEYEATNVTSPTLNTITGTHSTWVKAGPQTEVATSPKTYLQSWMGLISASGAQTLTLTFSATLSSATLSLFIMEWRTTVGSPAWTVSSQGTNTFSTTAVTPMQTSGLDVVPSGCFYLGCFDSAAPSLTALNTLPWITYDTSDTIVYGDAPTNVNPVPATGFTQSTAEAFAQSAVILNPGIKPAQLWVPPGLNMNVA